MTKQLTAKQISIITKALKKYIIDDQEEMFTSLMNAFEGDIKIIVEPDEYHQLYEFRILMDDKKGFVFNYGIKVPFERIIPSSIKNAEVRLKTISKEFLYRFSTALNVKLAGAYSMNREMLQGL